MLKLLSVSEVGYQSEDDTWKMGFPLAAVPVRVTHDLVPSLLVTTVPAQTGAGAT